MEEIEKALQALVEALNDKEAVTKVSVTITLTRPKPNKATKPENK